MSQLSKVTHMAQILERKISPTDKKIVDFIQQQNNQSTLSEIAAGLSISKSTVSRRATALQKEGLVIKVKENNQTKVIWVGGIPALESELNEANKRHVSASILAESYDSLVTGHFSLFSLLFESHCWEVIMNLKEGLNDVEVSQRIGNTITLDMVRRVIVAGDAHNLIQISTIREPAGNDIVKIFEPLYKIDRVNKDFKDFFIIIRGLASVMSYKMEGNTSPTHVHLYETLLDSCIASFSLLVDKTLSTQNEIDNELLKNVIMNYDFAPDMDRIHKHDNWRKKMKNSNNVVLDTKTDHLLITKEFFNDYKKTTQRTRL